MPSSECALTALCRIQGGTGKHVDGSITEPLMARPFQSLVMLSEPPSSSSSCPDGSLRVLPGFHAAALRYFSLAKQPAPEGGFTPLSDHAEIADDRLWVPVRRMPSRWRKLHAAGQLPPPCGAAQARSVDGLAKKLRGLAVELGGGGGGGRGGSAGGDALGGEQGEAVQPGDYVIWDPRLPHTTGESDGLSAGAAPRQVLYCAFMLARGNEGLAAEQRECRETGRHMRWAPSAQRDDEVRGYTRPSVLTPLGAQLYGYATKVPPLPREAPPPAGADGGEGGQRGARAANGAATRGGAKFASEAAVEGSPSKRNGRGAKLPGLTAEDVAAWEAAERLLDPPASTSKGKKSTKSAAQEAVDSEGAHEGGRALTAAHIAFFERYGYVVVEAAMGRAEALQLGLSVREYLKQRHGLDVDDEEARQRTFTLPRLMRAFSPDGSGMIELYWLASMEAARQTRALLDITRGLYAHTWASPKQPAAFKCDDAPSRPQLVYYIDRTSLRLPEALLKPVLDACPSCNPFGRPLDPTQPFVLRIRVPVWAQKQRAAQQVADEVFEVQRVVGARKVGNSWQYSVKWKGYAAEENTWEPRAHLDTMLDPELRRQMSACEEMAKATDGLCWVDETPIDDVEPVQDDDEEGEGEEEAEEEDEAAGDDDDTMGELADDDLARAVASSSVATALAVTDMVAADAHHARTTVPAQDASSAAIASASRAAQLAAAQPVAKRQRTDMCQQETVEAAPAVMAAAPAVMAAAPAVVAAAPAVMAAVPMVWPGVGAPLLWAPTMPTAAQPAAHAIQAAAMPSAPSVLQAAPVALAMPAAPAAFAASAALAPPGVPQLWQAVQLPPSLPYPQPPRPWLPSLHGNMSTR